MYPNNLPKNIVKRYMYILHRCLISLDSKDKLIIKDKAEVKLNDLAKDPNFNIFICYIEELINQKKLTSTKAKLFLLFCKEINDESNIRDPFISFYNQSKNKLIVETKFLEYFLTDDIKNKLNYYNYDYFKALDKLNKSLELIYTILPYNLRQNINAKARYVNINNDYGLINSLTIYKCYDLIFLSLNNPYFLIIEQIIHEQTHIKFGKLIETTRYERLFEVPYSAYSPFAEKVRPIEYIANGYFAFLSVLNLYQFYLDNFHYIKRDFEIDGLSIIKNRIKVLLPRVKTAENILTNLYKGNTLWNKFITEFRYNYHIPKSVTKKHNFKFTTKLSDIQNAEIILGLNSNKISRITIPISLTKKISELLPINKYLFSNDAYIDSDIEDLKTFKNLHSNIGSHLNSLDDDNTYVNCYIGKKINVLKKAVEMDLRDKSGDYFNIPKCCQKYFLENWDTVVKEFKGDFIKFILSRFSDNQIFKWQANSIAMYFDAGFTWHFPCTFKCKNTILISSRRYRDLKKVNKKLADRLFKNAIGDFYLLSDNTYHRITKVQKETSKVMRTYEIIKKVRFT